MIANVLATATTNQILTYQSTVVKNTSVIQVVGMIGLRRLLIGCWIIVVTKGLKFGC